MAKSKFFRVAVEGATTDGRTIQRSWLEDAAASYKPDTYTARINMEHIRGFSPEAPFNAYGTVLALKTEEIDLDIGGKTEKRLALFAQVDALDPLVELNRKGQKLFTSIEIAPEFADTGKAYLVGLAVTDSPASLGTEMLSFAAGLGEKSPLAHRKQDKANLFTAAEEFALELEAGEPADQTAGLFAKIAAFVDTLSGKPEAKTDDKPDEQPAGQAAPDAAGFATLGLAIGELANAVQAVSKSTNEQIGKLTSDFAALSAKVDAKPVAPFTQRDPATGGGDAIRTDC